MNQLALAEGLELIARGFEKVAAGVRDFPQETAHGQGQTIAWATTPPTTTPVSLKSSKSNPVPDPLEQAIADAAPVMPLPTPEPTPDPMVEPAPPAESGPEVAREALKTADLAALGRNELKALAEALGADTAGKKASELRQWLQTHRDTASTKTISQMRIDLELFCEHHRAGLEASGFFDPDPTGDPENPTYSELMADDGLIQGAWNDNVRPLIAADQWPLTR